MKFNSNKKYFTIAMYILLIVFISLLMIVTLFKFNKILSILGIIIKALMPIIWGFVIAYLLNPVLKFNDRWVNRIVSRKKQHSKLCRGISVTLTSLFALIIFSALIYFVIPNLIKSIKDIGGKYDGWLEKAEVFLDKFVSSNEKVNTFFKEQFVSIKEYAKNYISNRQPQITDFIQNFTVGFFNFLVGVKDFLLGFIVSIYLMISKEKLLAQSKKVVIALFSKNTCKKLSDVYHRSNRLFSGFISGKIIDSFIIGILCFIGMSIFRMPYAILISVIIGVTNIIPFFGPFIGAIPSALLILLSHPSKLLPFLIFIVALQQFDGNILGPKILGDSTGLPSFWVLFAIFLGGGLFGFPGMLLGVPTFALIYSLFRTYVEGKLERKHLPLETPEYMGSTRNFFTVARAKDMPSDVNKTDEVKDIKKEPQAQEFEQFLQEKKK